MKDALAAMKVWLDDNDIDPKTVLISIRCKHNSDATKIGEILGSTTTDFEQVRSGISGGVNFNISVLDTD